MNVEQIARALHEQAERLEARKYRWYRQRSWDETGQESRAANVAVVLAVLAGEKEHNGSRIPTWVKDLVHEEMAKQ